MKIIDATGPQGNAFAILAEVKLSLANNANAANWDVVRKDMMSGNYDHLCEVAEKVTEHLGKGKIVIVNR